MTTTTASAEARSGGSRHGGQGAHAAPMSHRQIMEALSGLMLGMFVAVLSSTIVSSALPTILADVGGGQSAYTWVVTAALLSVTATTPLWGKMSDLVSKKLLVQFALLLYIVASIVAGFSQNAGMLIACRVVQGIGAGGLSALSQVIMAAMVSPRERGRYSGYLGATYAVGTVSGPLIGGVITDTDWLGWRWCFYAVVPFAVMAMVVLQKTIHLPVVKRQVKADWLGAFFVTAAVCLLMVWVTLAGDTYDWLSWQTYLMVPGAAVLGLLFLFVETRASEPIIPLRLFRNATITLTSLASVFVGVAMFAGTVFLSQYFQLSRGKTPTMSGVSTIPMVAGLLVASMGSGRIITRTGRWKIFLVGGGLFLTGGAATLGLMRYDTPYWQVVVYMTVLGIGIGLMQQNLVLAVQNQVAPKDLGAASSLVTFFRTLGGAIGVSALGAALSTRISQYMKDGFTSLGIPMPHAHGGGNIPDLTKLPPAIRGIVESSYGHGIADVFLYAAPFAFMAFLLALCIREIPLKTANALQEAAGTDGRERVQDPVQEDVQPGGSRVHGFVRYADGVAANTAIVTLISPQGRQLGRMPVRPDGGYDLAVPAAGSYVLIAAADGHRPQASTVIVGDGPLGHDVQLSGAAAQPAGTHVQGTIRTGADHGPLAGARVTLVDAAGNVAGTATTGNDGNYAFKDLNPGEYTLIAGGYPPAAAALTVTGQGVLSHDVELGHE
ncbi:MFS transporter [Streptomyces ochraceiscleroticus]|uniref:MFS transporter n=1 Tax=Streptomyces ochraceiscleroticus TaxID=47761 RepID=A0ABW1MJ78_9ACTN|nr:MFS transporter [Streptomyces ochraceiscleroticus]